LDIAIRAKKPQEAYEKLQDAMMGYLKVAFADGRAEGLVPRHAPLSHRLRYYWFCLKAAVGQGRRNFSLFDWAPPASCHLFV
jgi:hypothetical protein